MHLFMEALRKKSYHCKFYFEECNLGYFSTYIYIAHTIMTAAKIKPGNSVGREVNTVDKLYLLMELFRRRNYSEVPSQTLEESAMPVSEGCLFSPLANQQSVQVTLVSAQLSLAQGGGQSRNEHCYALVRHASTKSQCNKTMVDGHLLESSHLPPFGSQCL